MRRAAILLGAGLLLTAASAVPASAAPVCAGTQNTVVLCVDPTAGTLYSDCVYVGPPPCIPVTVPGPTIQCGGNIGQYLCA
jgi:hypothetical protein